MCQVSLTPANEQWIKLQIACGEYDNESDLINQLIINAMNKQRREIEYIREKLIEGEQSGFGSLSCEEIRHKATERLIKDGIL
jgi:antitoxin ParD1/3/4